MLESVSAQIYSRILLVRDDKRQRGWDWQSPAIQGLELDQAARDLSSRSLFWGGRTLGNLVSAFVLLSTVILAVSFGIFAGYGAFLVTLRAFGDRSSKAVAILVPSQSHASGD